MAGSPNNAAAMMRPSPLSRGGSPGDDMSGCCCCRMRFSASSPARVRRVRIKNSTEITADTTTIVIKNPTGLSRDTPTRILTIPNKRRAKHDQKWNELAGSDRVGGHQQPPRLEAMVNLLGSWFRCLQCVA